MRAKDLDVARWLEFERPRNIRKLIDRHSTSLGDLFRSTVERNDENGGSREVTYYLTREQVTFMVGKSAQRRKLESLPWARTEIISVRDSAGRTQDTFCIDLDTLPMWLAKGSGPTGRVARRLRRRARR